MNHAAIIHVAKWRTHFANCINYRTRILKKCFRFLSFSANLLLLLCSQNNLTDGKEDQPEDTFSLLSVLLVGSLNFPFDRSRLAPRRQPSRRTFARKLWSKLSIYLSLSLFPSLSSPLAIPIIRSSSYLLRLHLQLQLVHPLLYK